jgi:hypothetical protein
MENTKQCKTCGKVFEKKINVSRKKWETMNYCSNPCINKGRISKLRGRLLTEEHKLNLHKSLIGRTCNTGRTHIKKGQHISPSTEFKLGNTPWLKGKSNPRFSGPNNPKWKGGVTPEHLKIRWSVKMKNFRNEIFKRDDYTCKFCGRCRKAGDRVILNVHHLKSFAIHKELRFDKNNVITLCRECHQKTDTYGVNTTI